MDICACVEMIDDEYDSTRNVCDAQESVYVCITVHIDFR